MADPRYVALATDEERYEILLYDSEKQLIGHGYRGPNKSRADQDFKYWTRTKGLEETEPGNSRGGPAF